MKLSHHFLTLTSYLYDFLNAFKDTITIFINALNKLLFLDFQFHFLSMSIVL